MGFSRAAGQRWLHRDPFGSGELNFGLSLYSGNFQRSTRSKSGPFSISSGSNVSAARFPATVSVCLAAGDPVVIGLHGWDDDEAGLGANGLFESGDELLRGSTASASSTATAAGTCTHPRNAGTRSLDRLSQSRSSAPGSR